MIPDILTLVFVRNFASSQSHCHSPGKIVFPPFDISFGQSGGVEENIHREDLLSSRMALLSNAPFVAKRKPARFQASADSRDPPGMIFAIVLPWRVMRIDAPFSTRFRTS